MANRPFVHLHCHTHYSLLDGASRVPELVELAKNLGMNAIAMTDHGNLFGAIEFYKECTEAGIKPIVGYEAYVAPTHRTDRTMKKRGESGYHLTLLAQNIIGFKNLVKLASIAYLEGYHYIPRIDKEVLEQYSAGIICLSGCASSEFSDFILLDQMDRARETAIWFSKTFGNNFYVEIQNNGLDIQKRCAEGAIAIANELGLPLVATCDAHYLRQEDNFAHDVLLCINTGRLITDENRMKYGSDQFYVRPPEEMYRLFPGHEEAVKRSQEIADKVDIQLDFKKRHFPVFTPPDKKKPEKYLRELCEIGLEQRYGANASADAQARYDAAKQRLEHELGIICKMGFAGYFLIVWDFVRFAISRNIPASARGSACGAVVSYVLKLSHVCPIEYDLLFERFLDPNRSEAPDIDIDFCQDQREEVIQYVRERYGEESVAQIGTFGTMAAKAAIKDVGRVMDIPLERVVRLTSMVPKVLNISLEESLKQSPDLRKEYDSDPDVRKVIDIAMKLEGTNRNAGTHAAGVVIANGPITDYVPVQRIVRKDGNKNGDAIITTQWVMGDLEKVGMLKMDFLGLRTLTVVENTLKLIRKRVMHDLKPRGERSEPLGFLDARELEAIKDRDPRTYDLLKHGIDNIPLTDKKTYELLQRGDARGVFQLESDGIRELLKRMKPDNIRDLIATNALYRPGPLSGGMVDSYVNRKHGREKPTYVHPIMEEILKETHGILVYQEQCMRILNQLGGIELASAYACIKAISKKKDEIINARRADFVTGAQGRGIAEEVAQEIFNLIVHFGGYGFNKSHSAAYAKLGYQTAYLKTHYPAEFMAALLTSEIDDSNKRDIMVEHIDDARRLGADVLPPNIQEGEAEFTVKNGKIVFGLLAIKGLGRGAAEDIVRARNEGGPFKDFFDFCERIDQKAVPKAGIERLIKAGAFDCTGAKRSQLWEALAGALQSASQAQEDKRHGQMNLFESFDTGNGDGVGAPNEGLRNIPEWPPLEKLKYEKESLDFYISSHPLGQYEDALRRFCSHAAANLKQCDANQEVFLGGMLTVVRFMNTKKARNGNSRYARFKLEDFSGTAECVMWPDDYVKYKDLIEEDKICFITAVVERKTDEPILQVTRVVTMEQGQLERTTGLVLVMDLTDGGEEEVRKMESIRTVLTRARGKLPVFLHIRDGAGKWLRLKASDDLRINPTTVSKADLETILGPGRVEFSRQSNGFSQGV
ncbi:MAG: DNA polymerase III subunit alpha [Planctomycetes bacterium]|nr:DNA polymerase III subunit alpha [Planctomycetota bacterium]